MKGNKHHAVSVVGGSMVNACNINFCACRLIYHSLYMLWCLVGCVVWWAVQVRLRSAIFQAGGLPGMIRLVKELHIDGN